MKRPSLPSTGRPLGPGDILILVRSRGELASLIVARLFSAGIPVAGVDRLHLHEPLAVQDLLAAVKFAVQPNDDLSLACLLVSPLIGWDQDQLRALAYGRKGSLWRELRQRAGARLRAMRTKRWPSCLRIADFTTPSRFLETILSGPMQGRRKLYSRLGMAARDAIDELMNSALEFERNEIASLDRFLAWFSRGTVDVQRDPGAAANEVRVMTVHGAKGLEAPVVILADATADPNAARAAADYRRAGRRERRARCRCFGRRRRSAARRSRRSSQEQEKRDLEEHMRLLYVALTRAADRLIVSGVDAQGKEGRIGPASGQQLARDRRAGDERRSELAVKTAMGSAGARYADTAKKRERDRSRACRRSLCRNGRSGRPRPKRGRHGRWRRRPSPTDDEAAAAAERSDARGGDARDADPPVARAAGRRCDVDARPEAAHRWLERSAGLADVAARDEIVEQVCGILSDAASPICSAQARWAKRRSPRPCPTGASSRARSTGC